MLIKPEDKVAFSSMAAALGSRGGKASKLANLLRGTLPYTEWYPLLTTI